MSALAPRFERIVDLRRRIHRVVDFIDDHLDADLSLERLADIACISPFHFHRLYSRMVGSSPADTVRRLRLLRAADDILNRRANVAHASAAAGYGSPQAFARAFRREFGCSARQMRALAAKEEAPAPTAMPIEFAIIDRPAMELNAILHDDVRSKAEVLSVDAQTYSHIFTGGDAYGLAVYFDDVLTPFDQHLRCAMCFSAGESPPARLRTERVAIQGGLYARLEKHGRLSDMTPRWKQFLEQSLPLAGWQRRDGPILRHLVSDRAITPASQRVCHFYVPVQPLVSH